MQRLSVVGCRERLGVVAGYEPRLEFEYPVPADQHGHPVPCQLRLERRLVELRVAEGGERRCPALHARDEALLAHDDVLHVSVPNLSDKLQALLRLAPHRVEWIVLHEQPCDVPSPTVASVGQITGLGRGAKGCPYEIDRGRDWLRPEGNYSHHEVDFCL